MTEHRADAGVTLEEQVAALEAERDEHLNDLKRVAAEFENYRKRMAAEVQAASARGKAELAVQLIGVIDNLERALAAAGVEPGSEKAPAEPLAEGFFLTYRELNAVLQRAGVDHLATAEQQRVRVAGRDLLDVVRDQHLRRRVEVAGEVRQAADRSSRPARSRP